jgi:DNA helicase HerA-like ATPase
MSRIALGKSGGKNVYLDLETLVRTRLLIQAGSGAGKSHLLRLIAEGAYGKIPAIIIDPEGEFASLREKFGYVLVGKGGETPAEVRSAGLVAARLLELHASAVCDLYALHPRVLLIPMKVVSDSDLIPVTGSEVKPIIFGAKRRWRSYRA